MPHIRYQYLSGRYILQNLEKNDTVNKLPVLQDMLHETYRVKLFPKAPTSFVCRARKGLVSTHSLTALLMSLLFFLSSIPGFQRFDREHNSSSIKLEDDEEKCTLQGAGWQNVRCIIPFSAKYKYCEFLGRLILTLSVIANPSFPFTVNNGPNVMIGVVEGDCPRNGYSGQYANRYISCSRKSA